MLHSDVIHLLDSWLLKDRYVFLSKNYFSVDYIVLEKITEDLYEFHKNSTVIMNGLTRGEMLKLLSMDIFVHLPFEHWNQDFHDKRANNCSCGAHATSNPDCHAFYCQKYKR
jgi:hypothetical protein